jgi:hypothetical protein
VDIFIKRYSNNTWKSRWIHKQRAQTTWVMHISRSKSVGRRCLLWVSAWGRFVSVSWYRQGFFWGWEKCFGMRQWYLLYNFVNSLYFQEMFFWLGPLTIVHFNINFLMTVYSYKYMHTKIHIILTYINYMYI